MWLDTRRVLRKEWARLGASVVGLGCATAMWLKVEGWLFDFVDVNEVCGRGRLVRCRTTV